MKAIPKVSLSRLSVLKKYGYEASPVCSVYEALRLVKVNTKVTLISFVSGKLLIQTAKELESKVLSELEQAGVIDPNQKPAILFSSASPAMKSTQKKTLPLSHEQGKGVSEEIIGSDETLKGDTFGGLVVCGVYADVALRRNLREIGVRDSKTIKNDEIESLAKKIMATVPYAVRNLFPEEYNKYTQTALMNRLHKEVYEELRKKNSTHVVDKFPGCIVGDVREERAESLYEEVAAASILARYFGLEQIKTLSERAGFTVPLGSTHVKHALLQLKASGLPPLEFVKISFSNVKKVFNTG